MKLTLMLFVVMAFLGSKEIFATGISDDSLLGIGAGISSPSVTDAISDNPAGLALNRRMKFLGAASAEDKSFNPFSGTGRLLFADRTSGLRACPLARFDIGLSQALIHQYLALKSDFILQRTTRSKDLVNFRFAFRAFNNRYCRLVCHRCLLFASLMARPFVRRATGIDAQISRRAPAPYRPGLYPAFPESVAFRPHS